MSSVNSPSARLVGDGKFVNINEYLEFRVFKWKFGNLVPSQAHDTGESGIEILQK